MGVPRGGQNVPNRRIWNPISRYLFITAGAINWLLNKTEHKDMTKDLLFKDQDKD